MCVVVPPMAAEPERRVPWGGGSSGSTTGRDDFQIKYFVYIKKKENKRRKSEGFGYPKGSGYPEKASSPVPAAGV